MISQREPLEEFLKESRNLSEQISHGIASFELTFGGIPRASGEIP